MRILRGAILASTILASPALAGDEILYDAAPDWVEVVELVPAEVADGPSAVLYDWQNRLEGGVEFAYTDMAYRLDNPDAVMQGGNLQLQWVPDNGDLTVNRLEILRGSEVIDLLAEGVTFDVLRRERRLEQRIIDGELTASLAVPGLREGDVLRVAYTTSNDEPALGDEVQSLQYLPSDPWQVGFSRVVVSWPADEEMYYDVEDRVDLAEPELRDGYRWLEVALPLAEPDPVPNDAPFRYRRPDMLRVGSFSDWQEVSRVMAPHFEVAAQVPETSEVAQQARAIMDRTDDPLERTALAVELVQEEVSYLADGLDGGGYLPQHATETWDVRYGDCKAKSVLLLSLLRRMGIESEVVLVNTEGGDAVPELLPLPAFNHMILHAVIDGKDYWLDGTMNGTRLATLADVPAFHYALPLRAEGAGLVEMTPRDPAVPQLAMSMEMDHTAGVDFPALFSLEVRMVGPSGTPFRAMVDEDNPAMLQQMAQQFSNNDSEMIVSNMEIEYDKEDAIALITVEGIAQPSFEWRDGRLRAETDELDAGAGFNPDRARRAWRDIPVATPGPMRQRTEMTLHLPQGGEGFALEGPRNVDDGFGNVRATMDAALQDGALQVVSETFMLPGEIAPEDLSQAKRDARRLGTHQLELVPPQDVDWVWELDAGTRAERAAPILAAYDAAIEFAEKDDFLPLQWRAYFKMTTFDFEGALADFDRLAEESPSTWVYGRRAVVHRALGNEDAAIADLEAAYDLQPDNGTALELARRLAYVGRAEEAQDLLDFLPVSEDERLDYNDARASVLALDGEVDAGFALIEETLADQPQNSAALNGDCWFRGLFSYQLDTALDRCTQAVERAGNPSAALDSRALVHFREGNYDAALADLDAVLNIAPGMAESRYLRGVVRLHAGDAAGQEDISEAVLMAPYLPKFYSVHGIEPPRFGEG